MKKLIFLLFLSCSAAAQSYLEPVENTFNAYASRTYYYQQVRDKLLADLPHPVIAEVIVLPSFTPEYVVAVDTLEGKQYLLRYVTHTGMIYENTKPITRVNYKRPISKQLADALNTYFFDLVSQTRYLPIAYEVVNGKRVRSINYIADGTSYLFAAWGAGYGTRSGKTHSPQEGSYLNEVVKFTDTLKEYVLGKHTESHLQQQLNKLTALLPPQ